MIDNDGFDDVIDVGFCSGCGVTMTGEPAAEVRCGGCRADDVVADGR